MNHGCDPFQMYNIYILHLKIYSEKNVEPNHHLSTMSKHVFLADDKMANISLDMCIHSLLKISQNIISNPHLATPSSP